MVMCEVRGLARLVRSVGGTLSVDVRFSALSTDPPVSCRATGSFSLIQASSLENITLTFAFTFASPCCTGCHVRTWA